MSDSLSGREPGSDGELEVLIVDDEPRLADLFAAWLEDECNVRTAYDGENALECMNDCIDLVLLDRRMPGLSGDEVLSELRTDGYEGWIVMITAIELDAQIRGSGYDEYLVKPISKRQLTDVIGTVVEEMTPRSKGGDGSGRAKRNC